MRLDWCADVPVEEQDPTVVAHIMMHDGPEGNKIQNTVKCDTKWDFQLHNLTCPG